MLWVNDLVRIKGTQRENGTGLRNENIIKKVPGIQSHACCGTKLENDPLNVSALKMIEQQQQQHHLPPGTTVEPSVYIWVSDTRHRDKAHTLPAIKETITLAKQASPSPSLLHILGVDRNCKVLILQPLENLTG